MPVAFRPWASVLDRWAPFDFKPLFNGIVVPIEMPSWIEEEDERRLRAYGLLEAYAKNKGRIWVSKYFETDPEVGSDPANRREYGDASVLIKTMRSSVLGDHWELNTRGAQGEVEDLNQEEAIVQHLFLEQWADKERFSLKLMESEEQSIKYGDSVYVLGWDVEKQRVRLNVYDPGFYFPKFNERESANEDFPQEVWIAWEFKEDDDTGKEQTYVRRMVWWFPEDSDNCWYEDAIWKLEDAVDDVPFSGDPQEWITEPGDLGVDFMPVVHVPNTPNTQEHFGESLLADVLQTLDDLASVDTDLQAAAATTGTPPIAIDGMGDDSQTSYGPGTVLRTGEGRATLLDTSRSLDALLKLKDALLERLATNSRTPESLIGRVKPNEVPSGIALTLSFTPHAGMITEARLVRDYKYRLLFKFVLRLTRANADSTELPETEYETILKFGSFLPADAQEAMTVVTQLITAKAISLETAVKYLVDHGYPISNWVEEIKRIEMRDFEGAQQIAALTGNPELAAERLGFKASDVLAFDDDLEEDEDDEIE